jgi:uridine kinase
MIDELKVFCKNIDQYVDIKGGDTLIDVFAKVREQLSINPICAHVNNKTEDLCFPVFSPKQVEFLDISSPSGNRVYVRSLCMILYKAIEDLFPGTRLRLQHSISGGYYCQVYAGTAKLTQATISRIKAQMQAIVKADIPFIRRERLTTDVREMFSRQGLDDKVRLLDTSHELYTVYYKLGNIIDSYYGSLAPSTRFLSVFNLVPYKDGMLLLGPDPADPSVPRTPIVQEKMYKAFTDYVNFNNIIGIDDVGQLNKAVIDKKAPMLIDVAEALHNKMFADMAYDITKRYRQGGARLILIAGPSSSGKTTSSKRLGIQLVTNLIMPKVISLDNYFVNRERTPRDENGDYDYESLYALDLDRFNSDLNRLIAGEEVELPSYNFQLGRSENKGEKMKLEKNNILLIEGIHGLNPELTSHIPDDVKFRVYVSALTTLAIDDHNWVSTSDNRLLRRIIRDYKYRGVGAKDTIARWPSVRRGEEKWIFPYQENADAMFNSSLIFELAVMKDFADQILRDVPRNVPEFAEAYRLRAFLSYFESISPQQLPSTSLLREFLGGSSFHY